MSKYKNKRLHITSFDIVFAIIFLVLLVVSAFFWSNFQETQGKFNIKHTKVDFIISAPSHEQITEIGSKEDVDKIVPYVYKTVDIKGNKKSVNSGLYIIENAADLEYTVFSDSLKIKTVSSSVNNPLYVSSELAKTADISTSETVNISVSGTPIEFTVVGIYKSDYRNVGGTAIALMQNDIKTVCGDDYRYNGAYISSNDLTATKSYLESYIGMGDLRSADEFDSDAAYQQYLENRNNKSSSESTFYRDDYIKELDRRYSSKLYRELIISLSFIVGSLISLLINLICKPGKYTKSDVEKDIRNNFTLKQEKQMYSRYNVCGLILYILAFIAYLSVSYFVVGNALISLSNISALALTVLFVVIARALSIRKLNKQFSLCAEKIEKEREKEKNKEIKNENKKENEGT